MARALLLVLMWVLQTALVLLLVNAEWIERQGQAERASLARELGFERYASLAGRTHAFYAQHFIESGLISRTERALLPQPNQPQSGMENLAPWFFRWLASRLATFWQLMYQALFRLELLRLWAGTICIGIACAGVDGLIRRQVRRTECAYPSADRYLLARRALLVLLFAPLLYLSLPLAVMGHAIPLWGLALALTVWTLASHAQHHI